MKKILLISLAFLAFTACKKKGVNTSDNVVVEEVKVDELKLITFSKTPCYGQCPTYTATITPQGEVAFEGRRFTPVEGVHEFKMTQDFVDQIFL